MTSKVGWAWGAFSLAAAFAACTGGYVEDPAGYCRQLPNEPGCVAPTGGQGGAAGATQQGQGGAPSMGSGGGPLAGSGGSGGSGGGGGLACEAPQIDCGGGCADLGTNPANCGECGYACADGQLMRFERAD